MDDLQIDEYRTGVNQPVTVRVTHKPTGITATVSDPSAKLARERAMDDVARTLALKSS